MKKANIIIFVSHHARNIRIYDYVCVKEIGYSKSRTLSSYTRPGRGPTDSNGRSLLTLVDQYAEKRKM